MGSSPRAEAGGPGEVSNIRARTAVFFSELSGFDGSRFTHQLRGQAGTSGGRASRGAEPASRLITEEIFFVLRFPVRALASKHSSVKAC